MHYLAGIFLSLFLALLLLVKKRKATPDRILLAWMLLMAAHQWLHYLDYAKVSYRHPHLLGVALAWPLLHGVLLYFYVSALTGRRTSLWSAAPHFLPFAGLVLLALPFYSLSGPEKVAVFEGAGAGYEWYGVVQMAVFFVSGVGYSAWSLRRVRSCRKQAETTATGHRQLEWLQYLSFGLGAIWLLAVFFDDQIIFSGVVLLVLLIGTAGIHRWPVFSTGFEDLPAATGGGDTPVARYAKSGLNTESAERLYEQLEALMKRERLYTDNELSLTELAARLNVHPNYLSQVVNEKEGKNFHNYLNTLRAEEFIHLVSLPEKRCYTLLALANECGFNSKSTFNKYVKQVSGKTPSAYLLPASA